MVLKKSEIQNLEKVRRLNIVNSITGIKPGNLVATKSMDGIPNVAIMSSVVHLSSNPALIGFITRPHGEFRRDTFNNIMETKCFTINHIHKDIIEKAHFTSAKFEQVVSEFDSCGLTEEYVENQYAPFVKESSIKIGLSYCEHISIKSSNTTMIVGEVEQLVVPDDIIKPNGYIDLSAADSVGISGLNSYYDLSFLNSFPYARVQNVPTEWDKNA